MQEGTDKKTTAGLLRGLALLAALTWASGAQGQTPTGAPASRAACLVKSAEPLKYPETEDKLRKGGSLRAKLTFTSADRPPRVETLNWGGSRDMLEAAEIYLLGYRLPCLAAGEQVVLEQEVVFTAVERGTQDEQGAASWACMRTPGPFNFMETQQTGTLIRQRSRGNVLLELSFESPDTAPKVRELYNSGPGGFRSDVLDHVAKYRLPCMKPGEPTRTMLQTFHYAGSTRGTDYSLRDMGLVAFLCAVKDVDKVPVNFDLDAMSCPFKLRFEMYRPAFDNRLTEIGPLDPRRKPLMDWLASLTMRLDKDPFEALFGSAMVITVPCGKINL